MTLVNEVKVLCYCVMGNHVHVLLLGGFEACILFMEGLLRRLSKHLSKLYGTKDLLTLAKLDVQPVTSTDMLLNEVVYLLRNPYKARICSPLSYYWSSCQVYFDPFFENVVGEKVGSSRACRTRFETHIPIPEEWEHIRGRILDKYFVDYRRVEKAYGDSLRFFDKLRMYNIESTVELSHGIEERIVYQDSELIEKALVVCKNEYGVTSHHQLTNKDLLLLARTLARRYNATRKQLSRILGLRPDVLEKYL